MRHTGWQSAGNMGCPREEGEDFPMGGDCPFCPFWKGKTREWDQRVKRHGQARTAIEEQAVQTEIAVRYGRRIS